MENQSKQLSQTDKEHLKRCGRYIPAIEEAEALELNGTKNSLDDAGDKGNNNDKEVTSLPSLLSLQILLKPFYWIGSHLENIRDWLKSLALLEILQLVGNLSIAIAMIVFIATEQQRRNTEVYQAWQVVTAAYSQPGSGGRKEALEFLNYEPIRNPWFWLRWPKQSLAGLAAPNAYLYKIQLPSANLSEADLHEADLSEGDLRSANLWGANLQGAILTEANLQGATLEKADLQGANLADADLSGGNLKEAKLQGARYTDENTTEEVCQKDLLIDKDYPCKTKFPQGFDPKAAGMVLLK